MDLSCAGAYLELANKKGQTAMDISLSKGDLEIAKSLIKAGYDLSRLKLSQFKAVQSFVRQSYTEKVYCLMALNSASRSNAIHIFKYL